ncbi:MAG: UDP-2,4-diacetamido-2,4,6-trideoxy-beta-L-altropyranose hydrolase [Proteobacteria bacterium]|nr:UDP-2,4-diacetamido-2,4,6-trideoxy-beta-L-altropyranose hydrolase [Pseudomonadota bacterium]
MPPRAVFRCDAGPEVGTGHVMRNVAIADRLRDFGWRVAFMTNAETVTSVPHSLQSFEVRMIAPGGEAETLAATWPGGVDLLVVDSYRLDAAAEGACRPHVGRLLAVDDLANRSHAADFLLDATPGRSTGSYEQLVPASTRLLLGPRFAPIRDPIAHRRRAALDRRAHPNALTRLLVTFGGADTRNGTAIALEAITRSGLNTSTDVVLGPAATNYAAISASTPSWARVHRDPSDFEDLVIAADLAIGACGVSALERCCLGLPTVLVVTADNQREIARGLAAATGMPVVILDEQEAPRRIAAALLSLREPGPRHRASQTAMQLVDGRGLQRLQLALGEAVSLDAGRVTLRLAEDSDEAVILAWQQRPGARRHSRNPTPPATEEHKAWFSHLTADPSRLLCIACFDEAPCGFLRLDRRSGIPPEFEVSLLIDEPFRGKGIGRAILSLARSLAPGARLVAEILPENTASLHAFAAAGYTAAGGGLYHEPPPP